MNSKTKETLAVIAASNILFLDGNDEEPIDIVFNHFDDLLRADNFQPIDEAFHIINENHLTTDVLISLLTITHKGQRHFPTGYAKLHNATAKLIQDRKEPESDLLLGLHIRG